MTAGRLLQTLQKMIESDPTIAASPVEVSVMSPSTETGTRLDVFWCDQETFPESLNPNRKKRLILHVN